MKYIDAEKLIAEIERWRDKAKEKYNESTYSIGRCDALAEFRNHIVSLQQEQTSLPDNLEEAAKEYANKEFPNEPAVGLWGTGDYEPSVDMEYPREITKDAFIAGAEWMAEQGAMKYWMAKDKDDSLLISNFKPYKRYTGYLDTDSSKWINISPTLSRELFPDIKLEDSPIEVTVQIRKKEK